MLFKEQLPLGMPVAFDWQVFDGDDVQRVEGRDFLVGVEHGQAVAADLHRFRVADDVLAAVGGAQGERAETAR